MGVKIGYFLLRLKFLLQLMVVVCGVNSSLAQKNQLSTTSIPIKIIADTSAALLKLELDSISTIASLDIVMKNQLQRVQNVGYPFAKYSILTGQDLVNDTLRVHLSYDKGELFHFDSLIIFSESKQSKLFYSNYLGIKEGDIFNQSKIDKIDKRIEQLNFVRLTQPASVNFSSKFTRVLLSIEKLKINQLDAIAAIQQDNNGQTFINGQARFKLYNILGKAEFFDLNWQRTSLFTQKAEIVYDQPFIFRSPIGIALKANFNRIDSTESSRNFSLGALYYLEGNNTLRLSYFSSSQQLKNIGDSTIENSSIKGFKGEIQMNHVNYFYSPTKGYRLLAEINIGDRKTTSNSTVTTLLGYAEAYKKIRKNLICKAALNTYTTISEPNPKFDYLLVGGLYNLRGFNTNSIKASSYYQLVIEPRQIIGTNSFIFAFFETTYIQVPLNDLISNNYINAVGAGLNIDTNGGILNLTFAMADGLGSSFTLSNSKIHIGYTLLF